MLKRLIRAWQWRKERKEWQKGYEWAVKELLAGRETAQSLQLWIDNNACTEFEKGVIRGLYSLIANGDIEDNIIP